MQELLKQLHDNFSIFPVKKDKSPVHSWSIYREQKIDFELLIKHKYFAIVCGFDNLEVIDIDNHFSDADTMYQFVLDNLSDTLLTTLPVIKTQGGGYHIYYKCELIEVNKKLASRKIIENDETKHIIKTGVKNNHYILLPNGDELQLSFNKDTDSWEGLNTLIETRGAGGYICSPPSVGYEVILNDILQVPTITVDERQMLLTICKSLNEVESKSIQQPNKAELTPIETGEKPGEKYNNDPNSINATISLLIQNGWSTSNNKHFKRPGKTTLGISATFGKVGINKFYCFSSNAAPFEPETSYSMFGVFTMLEHNGNYSNAANAIAEMYGMKKTKKATKKETENINETPKAKKTASQHKWNVLKEILQEWNCKLRFNILTKIIEFNKNNTRWEQIGNLCNDIVKEMEMYRGVSSIAVGKVSEMIQASEICEKFNPIDLFINSLPKWDGKDSIKELCDCIELPFDEDRVFFESMFKKHLIRTIRCATEIDYINRFVCIFYGPQEIGKSELIKWLCPKDLYDDEMIDTAKNDSLLKLARNLIINLEELDSLQRKEVSKLKAFISKGEINIRVAYGRFDERLPRIASLFGSTNKSDILADDTNTRWLILKVKSFDWKKYTKELNSLQIWSQIVEIIKNDANVGALTSEEKKQREQRNNQLFLETSSERELMIKWFEEGEELMTATDIKLYLEQNLHPIKINMYQLCRELKRLFGESKMENKDGKVGRYYRLKNNLKPQQVPTLNGEYEYKDFEF